MLCRYFLAIPMLIFYIGIALIEIKLLDCWLFIFGSDIYIGYIKI